MIRNKVFGGEVGPLIGRKQDTLSVAPARGYTVLLYYSDFLVPLYIKTTTPESPGVDIVS